MLPGSMDVSTITTVVLSVLCLLGSLAIVYPLSILLAHVLIEVPHRDAPRGSSARYTLAQLTQAIEDDDEEDRLLSRSSEDAISDTETPDSFGLASKSSIWQAWKGLWAEGLMSAFRALPAQAAYLLIHEVIFIALGGSHAMMQILNTMADEDSGVIHNHFSLLLMVSMVIVDVVLLPLDLTITRQLIGEPDDSNMLDHLKYILLSIGGKALVPSMFPRLLHSMISMLLQYTNLYLHKVYIQATIDRPAIRLSLAIVEIFWRLFSFMLFVVPIQAVLYRAETSIIQMMPPFFSRISYSTTYVSPLRELRQIAEEELRVSGTRYGKYLRFCRVLLCISSIVTITFAIVLSSWDAIGIL